MYKTKSELYCKLWTLGGNDVLMKVHCYKSISLVGEVDDVAGGVMWETSVLCPRFFCEP